jgi:hypothetical protein
VSGSGGVSSPVHGLLAHGERGGPAARLPRRRFAARCRREGGGAASLLRLAEPCGCGAAGAGDHGDCAVGGPAEPIAVCGGAGADRAASACGQGTPRPLGSGQACRKGGESEGRLPPPRRAAAGSPRRPLRQRSTTRSTTPSPAAAWCCRCIRGWWGRALRRTISTIGPALSSQRERRVALFPTTTKKPALSESDPDSEQREEEGEGESKGGSCRWGYSTLMCGLP